ncbi:beta-ketoacyl-ACP reductase [Synergistales bacterium]|nr:beta-ketoacyl-ACP reductase [Synergistales bacterium]
MKKLLDGKNAVVTGTRKGIGRAITEAFAANGANIWAFARSQDEAFESDMLTLSEKHGVWVKPVYADLSNELAIKSAAQIIVKEKLPVDILVNNAGIGHNALFQMTSMDKLKEQFAVNFYAPFLLTQTIVKLMLRGDGGSIVNIASSTGIDANSGRAAYGSAKAALICLTKVISEELGPKGIRANAIAPGVTDTDMTFTDMTEQFVADVLTETALKNIGKPKNIADAAVFLASDMSSYITGQVLRVDGGM